LPVGLDPKTSTSLGLKLVASLAAQIDGEFDIASRDDGTHASLTFRLDGPSRPETSL
jgi:two-component sensor histidine kinase